MKIMTKSRRRSSFCCFFFKDLTMNIYSLFLFSQSFDRDVKSVWILLESLLNKGKPRIREDFPFLAFLCDKLESYRSTSFFVFVTNTHRFQIQTLFAEREFHIIRYSQHQRTKGSRSNVGCNGATKQRGLRGMPKVPLFWESLFFL